MCQHKRLLKRLNAELKPWRTYTIAVDGRNYSGKSSMARFLAWQLGMPALETDMFLVRGSQPARYEYDQLKKLIETRHSKNWPVIIEGIKILETLELLQVRPDFLIFMKNTGVEATGGLSSQITVYLQKYCPELKAHFVFEWNASGDALSGS